jgi:hypothetical protein
MSEVLACGRTTCQRGAFSVLYERLTVATRRSTGEMVEHKIRSIDGLQCDMVEKGNPM